MSTRQKQKPRRPREQRPPRQGTVDIPKIYGTHYEGVLRPIVFVPGILGSEIHMKNGSRALWPPYYTDGTGHAQYLRNIKQLYQQPAKNKKAVGPFPAVYGLLLEHLKSLRGAINFHPFWYDWTQSNAKSGSDLARHIADVLALPRYQGKFTQVDLVCHSMGGIVTRAAARNAKTAASIRRTAYIASPHYGAPKAYFALHPDVPIRLFESSVTRLLGEIAWDFVVKGSDDEDDIDEAIHDLAAHMDSVYELLADRFYFQKGGYILTDERPAQNVPIRGMEETYYHNDWRFPPGQAARVRRAIAFKDSLGDTLPGDPSQILVIYSHSDPTQDSVNYDHVPPLYEFEAPYASAPANGDGTVPRHSASLANASGYQVFPVSGEHVALVHHVPVKQKLTEFLQKEPE
ncbi:MAG TPA: hypothetical protein VF211_07685 [Burkholderiales bacterium]